MKISDGQKCFLLTGFNNFFDLVTFISNGEWYLFDMWVFRGFYPTVLVFKAIAENNGPTV
jgi:hypothetical protein